MGRKERCRILKIQPVDDRDPPIRRQLGAGNQLRAELGRIFEAEQEDAANVRPVVAQASHSAQRL